MMHWPKNYKNCDSTLLITFFALPALECVYTSGVPALEGGEI
jgi:hypothetical protein